MTDPLPICYLNGEYLPLREARISPLDRGFLFADSVYEVLPVFAGRMFRFREHFDRLARSLAEIRIASPHTHAEWLRLLEELIRRNGAGDMYVYVQVTRGMEYGRNHAFPAQSTPCVFAMAAPLPPLTREIREQGMSAITVEDFRWSRCHIKSTALLANVLMKQQAADAGAQEAIIVRDGEVLEGASTSVFVVRDGNVCTPPNSNRILPGVTRDAAIELASGSISITVRPIELEELYAADEVWLSSSTRDVLPVTRIDGKPIGTGRPGPMWQRMNRAFEECKERLKGTPAL
ncbi:MAG TPA: D-amino acid aminotransferase [Steroidobacteraceae bacterium]